MNYNSYHIIISHETIKSDLKKVSYTGTPEHFDILTGDPFSCCVITGYTKQTIYPTGTVGYIEPLPFILTGGTNGTSTMTGLTIPILFTQNTIDLGYYSTFDGAILQADVVKNFIFSSDTSNPYTYRVFNTSDNQFKNFLKLSSYKVDWGDGQPESTITNFSPNFISHNYSTAGSYTITLKQTNPWGINTVKKTVNVPFTGLTIPNPNGTAYFTPNIGSWSSTPISYDYIFTGDSENSINEQVTSNYISIPFLVSGFTSSRITELQQYGTPQYQLLKWIKKENQNWGQITTINSSLTGYTIEGVQYFDFTDGTTVYIFNSSGLTPNWMVQSAITKNEAFLNVINDAQVQSDVFIERGKNSVYENVGRLGEVDNIGDLENYGYGFFKFYEQ